MRSGFNFNSCLYTKAVMISHDNVVWITRGNFAADPNDPMSGPLRMVSYLPLSHIAGQICDIHSPMVGRCKIRSTTFPRPFHNRSIYVTSTRPWQGGDGFGDLYEYSRYTLFFKDEWSSR